ncbi:MAG: hypothetical protein Q4C96_11555, partial [Planctomycetia bacterium]|nr:hypothetical protein [Planctomycetia bacterium]
MDKNAKIGDSLFQDFSSIMEDITFSLEHGLKNSEKQRKRFPFFPEKESLETPFTKKQTDFKAEAIILSDLEAEDPYFLDSLETFSYERNITGNVWEESSEVDRFMAAEDVFCKVYSVQEENFENPLKCEEELKFTDSETKEEVQKTSQSTVLEQEEKRRSENYRNTGQGKAIYAEPVSNKKKSERKRKPYFRTVSVGIFLGIFIILGIISLESFFQRYAVRALEHSLGMKILYGNVESSLLDSSVTLQEVEFWVPAMNGSDKEGEISSQMVSARKAVFHFDPWVTFWEYPVILNSRLEGVHVPSSERANIHSLSKMENVSSLSPLLEMKTETKIQEWMQNLTSINYFSQIKKAYQERYADLAERSNQINQELYEIQNQLKSCFDLKKITGELPDLLSIKTSDEKMHEGSLFPVQQTAYKEIQLPVIAAESRGRRLPGRVPSETFHFSDEKGNKISGEEWIKKEENVEFLIHKIARLIQLRQKSDEIFAECELIRRDYQQDILRVEELVAEDGQAVKTYLELPPLEESHLAKVLFHEEALQKMMEITDWVTAMQKIAGTDFTENLSAQSEASTEEDKILVSCFRKSEIHGNVTFSGQNFFFTGRWEHGTEAPKNNDLVKGSFTFRPAMKQEDTVTGILGKIDIKLEKKNGVLVKNIKAQIPVNISQQHLWACDSLPVEAVSESGFLTLNLECVKHQITGKMEMHYKNACLSSAMNAQMPVLSKYWQKRINTKNVDTLSVFADISGTFSSPRVEYRCEEIHLLSPVFAAVLNEIHKDKQNQISTYVYEKLLDAENLFLGTIEPYYSQVVAKTESIDHLQQGLQRFLVKNMEKGTYFGPSQRLPSEFPFPRTFPVNFDLLAKYSPKKEQVVMSEVQDQDIFAEKIADVTSPFSDENAEIYSVPVFHPEWSQITPSISGNAEDFFERNDENVTKSDRTGNVHTRTVPSLSEKAVRVPVKKVSKEEMEKMVQAPEEAPGVITLSSKKKKHDVNTAMTYGGTSTPHTEIKTEIPAKDLLTPHTEIKTEIPAKDL